MLKKILILSVILFCTLPVSLLSRNNIHSGQDEWVTIKTIHFNIYFIKGNDFVAQKSAEILENGYSFLADRFQHHMKKTVNIIVFPSSHFYENFTQSPSDKLLSKHHNKRGIDIVFKGNYITLKHELIYRLAFEFQNDILSCSKRLIPSIPFWIKEGIAQYYGRGFDNETDMAMRDLILNEKMLSLKDLSKNRISNLKILKIQGVSFFYFLEKRYEVHQIGELYKDIRDKKNIEKIFFRLTGKNIDDLNKEYFDFYKKKYKEILLKKSQQSTAALKKEGNLFSGFHFVLSPDKRRFAYVSKDRGVSLLIVSYLKTPKKKRILLQDGNNEYIEKIYIKENTLSWTEKGIIVFVAKAMGRDFICGINVRSNKVHFRIKFPFSTIHSVSSSKNLLLFSASDYNSRDLYLYNLTTKNIQQITSDSYVEIHPHLSSDGKKIIYSSNRNKNKKLFSLKYNLWFYSLANKTHKMISRGRGNAFYGRFNKDASSVLFSKNDNGIYNIYEYNLAEKKTFQLTDVPGSALNGQWLNNNKILYYSSENEIYSLKAKKINRNKVDNGNKTLETIYYNFNLPSSYFPHSEFKYQDAPFSVVLDDLSLGFTLTTPYDVIGFGHVAMTDTLKYHKLLLKTDFIGQSRTYDFNFNLSYFYLRYRFKFGGGFFMERDPTTSIEKMNLYKILDNTDFRNSSRNNMGMYLAVKYPFSRFFDITLATSIMKHENDLISTTLNSSVLINQNRLRLTIAYDNLRWGPMVPYNGFKGKIELQGNFNISGNEFHYYGVDIDLNYYLMIIPGYSFVFKGIGGFVFGPDSNYMKYTLGGYGTLPGHSLEAYSGKNKLLFSTAFQFAIIEKMTLDLPGIIASLHISGFVFADIATIWDESIDPLTDSGALNDIKFDFGFGLRVNVDPLLIFKCDFAWPTDFETVGSMKFSFKIAYKF